jgi:hypothetical protein
MTIFGVSLKAPSRTELIGVVIATFLFTVIAASIQQHVVGALSPKGLLTSVTSSFTGSLFAICGGLTFEPKPTRQQLVMLLCVSVTVALVTHVLGWALGL